MMAGCYCLQVAPGLGEIEAAIEGSVGGSWRDALVDVDERDEDGKVDDGSPECDLARPESEWVLALHGEVSDGRGYVGTLVFDNVMLELGLKLIAMIERRIYRREANYLVSMRIRIRI